MNKTALVLGSTGLIGKALVDQLLHDNRYTQVTAVTRREWPEKHPKLKVAEIDFDHLENYEDVFKVDDIYCCLGTTIAKAGSQEAFYQVDHDYIVGAAEIGYSNGAQQFIVISSMGADADSKIFYNRVKGETEDDLKEVGYNSLYIFRPSFLDGDRKEQRIGETVGIAIMKFVNIFGLLKTYQPVSDKLVARAMRHAAAQNNTGISIHTNLDIVALRDQ